MFAVTLTIVLCHPNFQGADPFEKDVQKQGRKVEIKIASPRGSGEAKVNSAKGISACSVGCSRVTVKLDRPWATSLLSIVRLEVCKFGFGSSSLKKWRRRWHSSPA